ncbi:anti-sigma factor family protein [Streptomyces sp. NPDC059853]|uniref:anti-sigma factor family protein n=1 Tax=Streptomyces sp. NPDC059853 TaxID=3346973 RepID=UPI00366409EC
MTEMHPEPADIAALDEDLHPPAEARRLREHLAGCPECAQIQQELHLLRQELTQLPAPEMPPDVAARIDAALAAEAAATPAPVSRFRALVSRETGRRSRLALAAVGTVVAVGLGTLLVQNLQPGSDASTADLATEADTAEESGDPLENQVRELLAEADVPQYAEILESADTGSVSGESDQRPDNPTPETTEAAEPDPGEEYGAVSAPLPSCVESAIGRTEVPLVAEAERYQGTDAYLVVLPHSADPLRVDAYVVDADCVSASPSVEGEVLVKESYPLDE